VCALLLALCLSNALGGTLYGVLTEFSFNDRQTLVFTVKFDLASGSYTNVTENLVFNGGSATVDGISAFDQKGQTYYFATDYLIPLIYSTNVRTQSNLAPINFGATDIESLVYDNSGRQLLTLYEVNGAMILGAILPQSVNKILAIPTTYNTGDIMVGTADTNGNYYLLAKYENEIYAVATIDIANGVITKSVKFNADTMTNVFPQSAFYDAQSKMVIGGGLSFESSGLTYYYLEINPATGAVLKQTLGVAVGIVTSWTFDSIGRVLYFAEAVPLGAYIYKFDLASKVLSAPVLLRDTVPASVEWSIL